MFIVLLVVLRDKSLGVCSEDVFCHLLIVAFEVIDKVLQDVSFISLEMQLEEHVMSDNHCMRNPVKRTFLNPWLK